LTEKKDCATRTFYQGKKGTATRAIVDLFEKNMLEHGKKFGPSIIKLMNVKNQQLAGLDGSEIPALNHEQKEDGKNYNNTNNNTETLSTVEKEAIREFLEIMDSNCISKQQTNKGETFFRLNPRSIIDYEKFSVIRHAARKAGAKMITYPHAGFIISNDLLDAKGA
jgi:hypothetical protein